MRSGFLNVTPSGSTAVRLVSQDKGSRNKRKFRADPTSALPLPVPDCNDCDRDSNPVKISELGYSWTMDSQSLEITCNADAHVGSNQKDAGSQATNACCNRHNDCNVHYDHHNYVKYSNRAHLRTPHSGLKVPDASFGCQQISCPAEGAVTSEGCDEDDHFVEVQEPDWDSHSEAQLEEMLLNLLDSMYKNATRKIMSFDVSEDEALKAVLRNGRCYGGGDALCSIVDNACACFKDSKYGTEKTEPAFTDLKQMEVYVLAEMVCILRKVRPFLSRGDAMWCLLMCDMNVAHACAMEDDAISSFNKDAPSLGLSSGSPSEPKANASSSLSCPITPGIPASQQTTRPAHMVPQPLGSCVNSSNNAPSAFSVPSLSSSSNGTIISHRHANANLSCNPGIIECSATQLNIKSGVLNQEQRMVKISDSDELHLTLTSKSGVQSKKHGPCSSESNNEECFLSTSQSEMLNQLACRSSHEEPSLLAASGTALQTVQGTLTGRGHPDGQPPAKFGNSLSEVSSTAGLPKLGTYGHVASCMANSNPSDQCSKCMEGFMQTDLQMGNLIKLSGDRSPIIKAWNEQDAPDDASNFSSGGTELSLAITSADSGITEVASESRITAAATEEATVCDAGDNTPINQFFGCTEPDGEEKKNEMIVQLIHRIKELEAQLLEWTEWAQQKVMQAARRLGKDSAELKGLRAEREEYLRLKMEKQTLEESTVMKKLSEMENALRKANNQVDQANKAVHRMEAENAELQAEMEAAKLTAVESVATSQEATRREKQSLKKAQSWEKQKAKLQEELSEEKQKLYLLQQQLSQANERHQQAEVRWRQEKKAKEEALLLVDSEKRLKELVETAAKRREEALQRNADTNSQCHRDDMQRLEGEVSQLRLSSDPFQSGMLRWGSGFGVPSINMDTCSAQGLKQMNARLLRDIAYLQDLSQRDIHRDRECVMCMTEEMSVVFLPCAHQVVCVKCNELHESQGLKDCLSCRTLIQQRIPVHGVSSQPYSNKYSNLKF